VNQQITPDRILQLGTAFWGSKAFLSAVELGLFTVLAEGPLDLQTLMKRLELHSRSAQDFFDALVSLEMLERQDGKYANTPETDLFLDRKKSSYVGGMLEMANAQLYPVWGSLTEGLRSGQPQSEAKHEGNFFEPRYANPDNLRQFLSAMTGISLGEAQVIAKKFPWHKYRTFVDVGTAQGGCAVQIALAHDHLSGGGFDLPPVQPIFDEYLAIFGLQGRLRFFAGDFFNDDLPSADVLIMGHILHNWNLQEKQLLLSKAYKALPTDGALIVYEAIIDDDRCKNTFGLLMSLNMLLRTPGGFDYTGTDCLSWMQTAGFRQTYVESLTGLSSMVIGIK
jgi:O-methyltransferase/methyltransferase family protein